MGFKIFILTMLMLPSTVASAQNESSDKLKPQWLHKLPTRTNSSFKYDFKSAKATSLDIARKNCLAELISSSGLSQGIVVSSDYKSKEKVSQVWNNGKLTEKVTFDTDTEISTRSKESTLFVENIDEYWTRDNTGIYYLTTLYAISQPKEVPKFDDVERTTQYGALGLWRSAIVPGWGQFYKGSNLKGGLILGGTVALAGSIIFTEGQRSDYVKKITKTHDANIKRTYATKRDHYATGRNICIGALTALYVYNLIDAVVAPGARRIVAKPHHNGNTYAVMPAITTEGEPIMTASITF